MNGANNVDCCENNGLGQFCCTNGADNEGCQLPTEAPRPFVPQPVEQKEVAQDVPSFDAEYLPPIPSFVPIPSLPKIIPVRPAVVNNPAPFVPPQARPRVEVTTSPNEYLPPLDVRGRVSDDIEVVDWNSWKVNKEEISLPCSVIKVVLTLQAKYGKKYATRQEEEQRKVIFEENFGKINLHNADFAAGSATYDLSANKYCDLTQDEFAQLHTGLRRDSRSLGSSSSSQGQNMTNVFMPSAELESQVEDEVDWRKKGAVTPVKNQGELRKSAWTASSPVTRTVKNHQTVIAST